MGLVGVTSTCMQNILLTSGEIETKLLGYKIVAY